MSVALLLNANDANDAKDAQENVDVWQETFKGYVPILEKILRADKHGPSLVGALPLPKLPDSPSKCYNLKNKNDDDDGALNIFDASFRGDTKQLEEILRIDGAKNNVKDERGNTPIIYACMSDKLQAIYLLLEAGADVHMKNIQGLNALHYTRGPLRRAQVMRKWELMSFEGRANTAALDDEFELSDFLRGQADRESRRLSMIQAVMEQQARVGTKARVTRATTQKVVSWVLTKGLEGGTIATILMVELFDLTFEAINRRENYRIQAELFKIEEQKRKLRNVTRKMAQGEAEKKAKEDAAVAKKSAEEETEKQRKEKVQRLYSKSMAREAQLAEEQRQREVYVKEIEVLRVQKDKQETAKKIAMFKRLRIAGGKA